MKKLLFTITCLLALGNFNLFAKKTSETETDTASSATASTPATTDPSVSSGPSSAGTSAGTTTAAEVPADQGKYRDGTYTGSSVSTHYGPVQVKAIISGGELTEVVALKYPSDRTSLQINKAALPRLYSESIQSQSAQVDMITGATITSKAFISSLGSALEQAAI